MIYANEKKKKTKPQPNTEHLVENINHSIFLSKKKISQENYLNKRCFYTSGYYHLFNQTKKNGKKKN